MGKVNTKLTSDPKFVRDTIKTLGRAASRQMFTVLALSQVEEGGSRRVKDIGFLGLRYLNTGSFNKGTGVKREKNNDDS